MRERLIAAATDADWNLPDKEAGEIVDAILTELRTPDAAMREVCTFEVAEVTFPAMIDAARAKP